MRTHRVARRLAPALAILSATAWLAPQAWPQTSVGRGARDPLPATVIVGSEGKGVFTGAGVRPDNMPIYATKDGAVPAGVTPLPHDIFATKDFYKDKDLWSDKRYYRCNSPVGLEQIWGAYMYPLWPEKRARGDTVKAVPRIREALDWIAADVTRPENEAVWEQLQAAEPTRSRIELFDMVWWMYFSPRRAGVAL